MIAIVLGGVVFIAGAKGLIAGMAQLAPILLVGFLGYGISLVMFVLALRGLGSARTGAYFSTAPFLGAAIAVLMLGESVTLAFWIASALMAVGVWLHLTERHAHDHQHDATEHGHRHVHSPQRHNHAHFPDVHHRHRH